MLARPLSRFRTLSSVAGPFPQLLGRSEIGAAGLHIQNCFAPVDLYLALHISFGVFRRQFRVFLLPTHLIPNNRNGFTNLTLAVF